MLETIKNAKHPFVDGMFMNPTDMRIEDLIYGIRRRVIDGNDPLNGGDPDRALAELFDLKEMSYEDRIACKNNNWEPTAIMEMRKICED